MTAKRMKSKDYDEEDIPKSLRHDKEENGKKKKKKKKHLFLKIVLVLIIIIVILAGVLIGYAYSKIQMIDYDDINENEIVVNQGLETATGYRNIVLYGVDSRDNGYEHALSDTIMIVSINQDTKKVKIASVYRDTYLKVGNSYDKITHAYAKGGPTLSLSSLNTNLDLDLKEFVTVNFNVVVDVINEIGGVEKEITKEETKYINRYIDEINNVTNHKSEHITKAGTYNLDGVQALAYSRIRYTKRRRL